MGRWSPRNLSMKKRSQGIGPRPGRNGRQKSFLLKVARGKWLTWVCYSVAATDMLQ